MNHLAGGHGNEGRTTTRSDPHRFTPRVFKASDFTVTPTIDRKSLAIRAPCGETVILSAHETVELMVKLNEGLRAIE